MQGKGVEREGVVVNERATFTVDTGRAGNADLDVAVVDGNCKTLDVRVVKENDLYQCTYTPTDAVKHSVIVTYGHVTVPRAPFKVGHTHRHTRTCR